MDRCLYYCSPNGELLSVTYTGSKIFASPILTQSGNIFLATLDGSVMIVEP